ncbi:VWFA domain-containing protein [Entamoeba marina]
MKCLFACDNSGSTGGHLFYWKRVKELYEELLQELPEDEIDIMFWGSRSEIVNKKKFYKEANNKSGNYGGTDIYLVADHIVNNDFHGKLVLITDGEVWDVPRADEIMKKHTGFSQVVCHIINNGSHNLSVTCPFTRGINSTAYTHTQDERKLVIEITEAVKNAVFGLDKMNVDEFLDKYNMIEGYFVSQSMGRAGNEKLRDLILTNKKRLMYEYRKKFRGNYDMQLLKMIETKDFQNAIPVMQEMTDKYYEELKSSCNGERAFERKLQHLIDLCGNTIENNFDMRRIRGSREKRAKNVDKATMEGIDENVVDSALAEGVKLLMECPISGEEDVGVLLLTGENVLDGVPKNVVNDVINCPLRLVNYPELVKKVKSSIGGIVGMKTIKETQIQESPVNGKPITGGIILSNNIDLTKVVNSSIARLFTRDKLLGSPLYYLISIYYILKDDEEYSTMIEPLKKVIVERLKTNHTFAGLTGKSQYVTTLLRTDVALWYILHSSLLELPPPNDPLALHIPDVDVILHLLEILGYPVDEKVLHHIDCMKAMRVLHQMKFLNSDIAETLIRALYQKAIYLDKKNVRDVVCKKEFYVPFVFVDGKADQQQIDQVFGLINPIFKKLSVDEILFINSLIHSGNRLCGTSIPMNIEKPVVNVDTNWDGLKCGDFTLDLDKKKKKFNDKYGLGTSQEEFILFLSRQLTQSTIPVVN